MATKLVLLDKEARSDTAPGIITAHHASAIEIDPLPVTAYGRPSITGFILVAIGVALLWINPLVQNFTALAKSAEPDLSGILVIAMLLFFASMALLVACIGVRILALPDAENAIIFDRKTQKIYFAIREPKRLLPVLRMHGFDWADVTAYEFIESYSGLSSESTRITYVLAIHVTSFGGKTEKRQIGPGDGDPRRLWGWLCQYMNGRVQPPAEILVPREKYVYGYKDTLLWYMPYLRRTYFTAMRQHHPTATFFKCALAPVIWAWLPLGLLQKAWLDWGLGHTLWPRSIINAIGPILKTRPPVCPEILPEKRYQRRIVDDADTGGRA